MRIDEPLWTAAELSAVCGGIAARPWYADGLQIDSREVLPGDLFVALKGQQMDGHDFVRDAFARGAVAAIVSGVPEGVDPENQRLVHVADTYDALLRMAKHGRVRAPAKVIAVTGSAGKTSVVQALRQALERVGPTHASIKSFNNHVGVPLSLARLPRQSRYGVFEIGMSGPGEIANGAAVAQPDIAIITSVGSAHAENFTDETAIAIEKSSIFNALTKNGVAIIGMDHPHGELLREKAVEAGVMAITVSVLDKADVKPLRLTEQHDCTCLTADIFGTPITYKVSQPGREWVLNSLLVLAAVKAAGADLGQAALALAGLEAEPGRGRCHQLRLARGTAVLIDDSYNANPLSVRAALRRLSLMPVLSPRKRIAVLADMAELGGRSEDIHLSLARDLKRFGVNRIIAFGDQMARLGEMAGIQTDSWGEPKQAAVRLMAELRHGDAVMVKGANSAGLDELVHEMLMISKDEIGVTAEQKRRVGFK